MNEKPLFCRVKFMNDDGDIIFEEDREVPELSQEINNCYVMKIEHIVKRGDYYVIVSLLPIWKYKMHYERIIPFEGEKK